MEGYYWILVILVADLCVFFKQIAKLVRLKKVTWQMVKDFKNISLL